MFNSMKTIKEIQEKAKVSRAMLYRRIERLERIKGDDYKPEYNHERKRVFSDEDANWLIHGALKPGRPKKVYREE